MVRHFFLDKTNTIYINSFKNTGLNPIMELNCGKDISRGLLHFDEAEIVKLVEDKTFADLSKLSCHLKMTNCFSIDSKNNSLVMKYNDNARRASSFDIVAFKLPQEFDEGRGYDNNPDFWERKVENKTNFGSSWYFSQTSNANLWPVDKDKIDFKDENLNIDIENGLIWILDSGGTRVKVNLVGGIYSNDFILSELEKFYSGETSIIINAQHFDYGYENLDIDITNYVKDIISGSTNYGIGLMFSLPFESWDMSKQQYVGFFTDHTNTFFHPYVECIYDNPIMDDRENFCLSKENKLYLYAIDGDEYVNLDNMPICIIGDKEYEVEQIQKGVYCAQIKASREDMESGTIEYDNWSNLALNGEILDDIEMEFEVKPSSVKLGPLSVEKVSVSPSIYGIGDSEVLNRGEVRVVHIDFRKNFEINKKELIDSAEYEIYVKDGNRKITVINFTPIEKAFLDNYFVIHTEDFIPGEYHIGIRVKSGKEINYFDNVLKFNILNNITEIHQ